MWHILDRHQCKCLLAFCDAEGLLYAVRFSALHLTLLLFLYLQCGRPGEVKQCACGAKVGGINHKPERGFVKKEM